MEYTSETAEAIDALRATLQRALDPPVKRIPTLTEMRTQKATELRALFSDGYAKGTERAAMAVLGGALIPLNNLPTRVAVECATGEDQYAATEGDIDIDFGQFLDDLTGDPQFKAVVRRLIRAQLQSKGIEVIPWDGDS